MQQPQMNMNQQMPMQQQQQMENNPQMNQPMQQQPMSNEHQQFANFSNDFDQQQMTNMQQMPQQSNDFGFNQQETTLAQYMFETFDNSDKQEKAQAKITIKSLDELVEKLKELNKKDNK